MPQTNGEKDRLCTTFPAKTKAVVTKTTFGLFFAGFIIVTRMLPANLQIHVKPQNEKSRKDFSKGKKGMTNQAGQRGIFANRLSRTIISG